MTKLILASGSAIRARLLSAAGVAFEIVRPEVDEAAIKARAREAGLSLREVAQRLADAKACAVDRRGALVLGSDQIMTFEGRGYDKPRSMAEARERLALLQGKPHTLINAVSIARAGEIVFRRVDEPRLHMRAMRDDEIAAYLAAAGEGILDSVGAYQVEALGARLFERIDGDFFAVLGLSLLPVLGYLRAEGLLEY
ncbi:MAG: Maf-like protein [Parvularculaceae bacterium]|nr:Maf-like protein [Parvularculaceae bacterium]